MHNKLWEHYKDIDNKFKIVKHLKNRETALLTPAYTKVGFKSLRNIRCHSTQTFDFMLKWAGLNQDDRPVNIYHSLATYKEGIPQEWKMANRKETYAEWDKKRIRKTIAYDFVVDIDAPTHKEIGMAQEDTIRLYNILKPYNPSIRFSGKGFHIYISYEDMCGFRGMGIRKSSFNPDKSPNVYNDYYIIAKAMHDTITEFIDLCIYDSRRLIKCPNTLAFYGPKDVYICKELTIKELEEFELDKYKIKECDADA